MDHKPFDPARASVIKRMFELYATGDWSLSDITRYAREQGFVTVPMRRRRTKEEMLDENLDIEDIPKISRPVTENHISRILSNPFYTGKVLNSEGRYISSTSHEALVDEELFNKVQSTLKRRQTSIHYTEKLEQPLRGMVRCAHCKRVYTPYIKKGIQYYSSRCAKDCPNMLKNINFNFISEKIGVLLSGLFFTDEENQQMDACLGTDIALLEEKRQKELEQIERKKRKIREDLAYIRSNKLILLRTGVYTPEGFIEEEDKLSSELLDSENRVQISNVAMYETVKDIQRLSELVKDLIPYYGFANPHEKERIVRTVFSELYLSENTLKFKCKRGFKCFKNRFRAVCDPTAWISELALQQPYIKLAIQDLQTLVEDADPQKAA